MYQIVSKKFKWFNIMEGELQGSIFSLSLFITYHADMSDFLGCYLSHYYVDDLVAVIADSVGMKFSLQCLDLERKWKLFFDNLEYSSILIFQPISYRKIEAVWSVRAIRPPKTDIRLGSFKIP